MLRLSPSRFQSSYTVQRHPVFRSNHTILCITAALLLLIALPATLSAQIPGLPRIPTPASPAPPAPAPAPTVVLVPTPAVTPTNTEAGSDAVTAPSVPTAIQIQTVAPPSVLTDDEKDALQDQKELVSRMPNPNDLIDYFQSKYWTRQYEKAFACIDWGESNLSQKSKRNILYMLDVVLGRLDTKDVYDYPTDESTMVQSFHSPRGLIEFEFVRGKHNNWMFTHRTIRDVDRYFTLLKNELPLRRHWLMQHLPTWTLASLYGIPTFRILFFVAAIFLGLILKRIVQWLLYVITRWTFNVMLVDWDRSKLTKRTWMPVGLIVMVSFWFFGFASMIPTPENFDFLHSFHTMFVIAMSIWMFFRMVDLFALWLRLKMRHRDPNIDIIFFPLFTRTTKLLILCFGLVALAQSFQWPIVGLVSGMGIGGIAIAFAAKETIANLFGSVTVLADRPFVIGDWIKTGDIEGTVEGVGMRSTRIRTFYNSLVTVPNNNLTTAVIDNMGARYYRRYRTFISVPLDTEPERIEAFCEGVRELIRRHPYTRKDLFHVYLNEFKSYSLDILLNVFFVCPDSAIEYRERGRLIADILRLAAALDIRLALPTQVQHNYAAEQKERVPVGADPVAMGRSAAIKIFPLDE